MYAGPIPTLEFQSLSSRLRSITGPDGPCLSENSRSRSETSLPVSQATSLVSCSSGNATILTPRAIAGCNEQSAVSSARRSGDETIKSIEDWNGNLDSRARHSATPASVRCGSGIKYASPPLLCSACREREDQQQSSAIVSRVLRCIVTYLTMSHTVHDRSHWSALSTYPAVSDLLDSC